MRIVGLDLSLTSTGAAIYDSEAAPAVCTWLTLSASKGMTGIARIDALASAILDATWRCNLVVLEDFSFGSTGAYMLERAELRGAIRRRLYRRGTPEILVAPAALKKFVAGGVPQAERTKELIIREVYRLWGLTVNNNDAADAVVLAQIGAQLTGAAAGTLKPWQRAVLDALRHKYASALEAVA